MNSNTHSTQDPGGRLDGLAVLAAAVDGLAAQELNRLSDAALAEQVLALRRLVDRLEGHWLQQLAAVDGRGAAGADQGQQVGSTAGWLRTRLQLGAGAAASFVRTARALFRGPLAATAEALIAGELTVAHARVLAHGTQDLPDDVTVAAEPVLVEAAGRLDPPRLRRVIAHLCLVADPAAADRHSELRHGRRGLWLAPPWRGWSPLMGCWSLRRVRLCWRHWRRWPARLMLRMAGVVGSAGRMRWLSWPAGLWRVGGCPRPVGCGRS